MKISLYKNGFEELAGNLENMIRKQIPNIDLNTHGTFKDLIQALRQPLNDISVVLLVAASIIDLVQFNQMKSFFDNTRIILILPNRKKHTFAWAVKLSPSFIGYIDSEPKDITSVLKQIAHKKQGGHA